MLHDATAGPGSPLYAAPEAGYPAQHSPKMDTYSYGVLLIEMCLRQLSSPGQREAQILCIQWAAMLTPGLPIVSTLWAGSWL